MTVVESIYPDTEKVERVLRFTEANCTCVERERLACREGVCSVCILGPVVVISSEEV